MSVTAIIFPFLLLILWIILGSILFLLIISIIDKSVKFFTLKFSAVALQKGELIRKKAFITKDSYELRWFGEIKSEGKYIVLCVHDILGTRKDFEELNIWMNANRTDASIVSFDQRGCGENKEDLIKNYGSLISDLKEMIVDLKEKYPEQKLMLLGEGFGASAVLKFSNDKLIENIIVSGIRTNKKHAKFNFFGKLYGWVFSSKTKIYLNIQGNEVFDSEKISKTFDERIANKNSVTIREWYQQNSLSAKSFSNIKKSDNKPILILQGDLDIYSNPMQFASKISKIDSSKYKLHVIKNSKHSFLGDKSNVLVYKIISDFII